MPSSHCIPVRYTKHKPSTTLLFILLSFFYFCAAVAAIGQEQQQSSSHDSRNQVTLESPQLNPQFCLQFISHLQQKFQSLGIIASRRFLSELRVKDSLREREFTTEEIERHIHGLENGTGGFEKEAESDPSAAGETKTPATTNNNKNNNEKKTPSEVCDFLMNTYVKHCTDQIRDVMSGRQVASVTAKKRKMRKILKGRKSKLLQKEDALEAVLYHTEEKDWEAVCILFANEVYNGDMAFYHVEYDDDDEEDDDDDEDSPHGAKFQKRKWQQLKDEL